VQSGTNGVIVEPLDVPLPFRTERAEASGLRVELGPPHGRAVVFARGEDQFAFTPDDRHYCENPVVSKDGFTVFTMLWEQGRRSRNGSDYVAILRFDLGVGPLRTVFPSRILTEADLLKTFGGDQAAVMALDRVAASGRHLLVRISARDPVDSSQFRRSYKDRPYWYDLADGSFSEPDR
jgi:hypothetical protein